MKRPVLLTLLPICSLSLAIASNVHQKSPSTKPNIIYIYADDLGYNELGCYGQQKIQTPNLDRMAKEGVRFKQHYSGAPVSAPSRCMLMTGRHGGHSYIRSNYGTSSNSDEIERGQMPLPEGAFTIGHMLQRAGYVTAAIGKWGLGMHNTTGDPNKQGFDYFYGYLDQGQAHNYYPTHLWENGLWDTLNNKYIDVHRHPGNTEDSDFEYYKGGEYAIDKMTEKALRFIKLNRNRPFFLYLPYTIPHASLQAPEEAIKKYIGLFTENPYYGQQDYASSKYPRSTYAAMITYLDTQAGIIMDLVKNLGLDENTVIMFSSDNGAAPNCCGVDVKFFNSVGPLRDYKGSVYEGGIRVPLIARWPGTIPSGRVSDFISVQYDMMSTIADIVGITPPANDGISIFPSLVGKDKEQEQRSYIFFEFPGYTGQIAIRMGNWKAVKTGMIKNPKNPWQLYDLSMDISESNNIAEKHPDLLTRFDMILKKEHRPAHIKEWEFINESLVSEYK